MDVQPKIINLAYKLFILIAVVFILYIGKPLIVPLIFAVILSILFFPIVQFLEEKWHFNRIISALTVLIILIILVTGLMSIIYIEFSSVMEKSTGYGTKLKEIYINILQFAQDHFGINKREFINQKGMKIETLIKENYSKLGDFLVVSGTFISNLVLMPIYIFFFLIYRHFFVNFLHMAFPKKENEFIDLILQKLFEVQQNYLIGFFSVMLIVGTLNTIGLLLLGIDNAIFFGFLAALLLIIPYVGVFIGSLIPALVALVTKDSAWYSLGVIGVFTFIQFLEGNFITPHITGSKVSVNAFMAIFSLLAFSMLWGISGMLLALPVTASLKIIFDYTPSLKPIGFLIGQPEEEHLDGISFKKMRFLQKKRKEI